MSTESASPKNGKPSTPKKRIVKPTQQTTSDDAEDSNSPKLITPKEKIMLAKEKKKLEEEAHYTYQPQLEKRGRDKATKQEGNRFDKLYSDALKRHLETKWKESVEDNELTFKPKLHSRPSSRASSRSTSRDRSVDKSVDRLYKAKVGNISAETEQEIQSKFGFKPKITKRASSIDRSKDRDINDKLYQQTKDLKEKQDKLKKEAEERQAQQCTFKPKISGKKSSIPAPGSTLSVTERMRRYEELKAQKIAEKLRLKEEQELENVTFKPNLRHNKRSSTPTSTVPVHERLSVPIERDLTEINELLKSEMTFKPKLMSKRAPSPNAKASEYNNVHERLFREGEQRKKEAEKERQLIKEGELKNITFKPVINPTSKSVADDYESEPVFERLAAGREHMQEILDKIKYDMDMRGCTFKPQLATSPSKSSTNKSQEPIHVRAAKDLEKKKETLEKMRLEKEKKELEEVTFAPHIPESSAQITKRRSVHGGDGEKEDIFSRLAAEQTHNLDKTIEMGDIYDKKPALPEKALDQVFRRLSTTPIRTHSVSDMSYYSGDVPDDRSIMTRSTMRSTDSRRSIVLAETDLDQLFNRLSVPATKGADGQPDESGQSRRKSMSAKDVANVVRRLSVNKGSPSETFSEINPMASPSPTRSASVPKAMSHTRSSEKVRSVSRKPSGIAGIQEDLEEESPKATPTARDSNKEPAKRSPSLGYSSSSVRKMFPDAQEEVTSPFKPPAGKDTNGKATVLTNTVFNIKNSDNNRVVVPRKPKNTREDPDSATSNTIISSAASNSPEEEQTSTEVDQRGEMLRNKQNHMHTSSPNPLMNRRGSAVVSPSLPPNIPIPPPQILEEKKKPLAIPVAGTPKQSVAERIAALNKKKAVGAAAAGPIELSSEPKVLRGKKKKTTDSNSVSASDAASSSNAENIEALQGAMQDKVAEESASNNGKSIESGTNSLNESGEEENNIEKEPHDHHFNSIDDEFDVVDNADQ